MSNCPQCSNSKVLDQRVVRNKICTTMQCILHVVYLFTLHFQYANRTCIAAVLTSYFT